MRTFYGVTKILFVHAHPDDETLSTGAVIAELTATGIEVGVVTATRGEQGEATDGPWQQWAGTPAMVTHREQELSQALHALGVTHHVYLGTPPARVAGQPPRRYTDSGMSWVTPTVAGPSPDAGTDSLSLASVADAAADLLAYIATFRPDVVVSYDHDGGYRHPDHVACHRLAETAACDSAVPFIEVVSTAFTEPDPSMETVDLPHQRATVVEALRCHASQLTVHDDHIIHVGGQIDPISTTVTLSPPRVR